jgi:PAS domain S-box-containing protein
MRKRANRRQSPKTAGRHPSTPLFVRALRERIRGIVLVVRDDAFLLAMIHAQPDPVVGVDRGARIRAWNASATQAFGFSEEEAYGRKLDELMGIDLKAKRTSAKTKSGASVTVVAEAVVVGDREEPSIVSMIVLRPGTQEARTDVSAEIRDLPPRLRQILDGLCAGLAEKEIAAQLNLSPHTVHDYVRTLYRRFGVQNRAGLVARTLVGSLNQGSRK